MTKGYIEKIKKVIELNGERLEPEDLRKIKQKNEINHEWEKPKEISRWKIIYNDGKLRQIRKREVKDLKKERKRLLKFYKRKINESKKTKKNFKKRDLKYLSWGRAFQITDATAKF